MILVAGVGYLRAIYHNNEAGSLNSGETFRPSGPRDTFMMSKPVMTEARPKATLPIVQTPA
jgi:hypothetical protein